MHSVALVVLALSAAVSAAPQQFLQSNALTALSSGQSGVRVLNQRFDADQAGNYQYQYEQDNGQKVEEAGRVQSGSEPETGTITKQGSYEFVSDDGNTYTVTYVADEGGFQPLAAHLPQAPAQIPEYAQLRQDYPQLFWAEQGGLAAISSGTNQRSDSNNQRTFTF